MIKSLAEEIAKDMAKFLEKEAAFPVEWESFKKVVDSAQTGEDLQVPWRWIQTGRTATYEGRAFQYFLAKEKEMKSKFGLDSPTR